MRKEYKLKRLISLCIRSLTLTAFVLVNCTACNNIIIEDDCINYEKQLEINSTIENLYFNPDNYLFRIINNNVPNFNLKKYDGKSFEKYSDLDGLGRCGLAEALIGEDIMPSKDEKRGSIGMVKPSGWSTPQKKYDSVEGKYLYNRCHLIGWQLSGENANENNLITGTSWLNRKAMLPYEQQVANYIRATHNHVLYRVTPIFEGDNLVASRIQIEALSYEDKGVGIKMNILLENYQPGIHIDYATGDSYEEKEN